jgi:erythromycin esterase
VQAFIETGVGDASKVAHEHISYGFGDWQENVDLIQWIRDYNANPTHRRKIRFYGFDLSLGGDVGATPRPAPFEAALSLLSRTDSVSADRLRQVLQPILRLPPNPLPSLTAAEREAAIVAVDDLLTRLERNRPSLQATMSGADLEWGYRSALVAQQVARFLRLVPVDISAGIPPWAWEGLETRDAAMADNVRWILAQEGPTGRVLVFAHNVHVMNARARGTGVFAVFAQPPNQLGVYLRSALGSDLVIIGTSSAANGSGLPGATLDSNSLDASLARVGPRRFLLDLRASRNNREAREWLAEPRLLRANFGNFYHNVPPTSAFDAIVFIDTLTPAVTVRSRP